MQPEADENLLQQDRRVFDLIRAKVEDLLR